jgi:hypothetical protein
MKKLLLKPGFELVFALALIAILGLPPLVLAQTHKDLQISIEHGDTIINGKNIKDLSGKEREDALRDINKITGDTFMNRAHGKNDSTTSVFMYKRRADGNGEGRRMEFRRRGPGMPGHPDMMEDGNVTLRDSSGKIIEMRMRRPGDGEGQNFAFRYHNDDMPGDMGSRHFNFRMHGPMGGFNRKNTQHFNYSNTGNDGISTDINFDVSEPSGERLKRIAGIDKATMELNDLSLVPEFTSGKTLLMFNLPGKGLADVKFTDSDGKMLWSEKISGGSFSKKINIPLNGVYYLVVKQGGKEAVKRIVKGE